jgi:hypothetical protein
MFPYGQEFLFGHTVFLLCFVQVFADEFQQPVVMSSDRTKLKLRAVNVYFKLLQEVRIWTNQDTI